MSFTQFARYRRRIAQLTRLNVELDSPQDVPPDALDSRLPVPARVLPHRHAPVLVPAQQTQPRPPRRVRVRGGREVHRHDDP